MADEKGSNQGGAWYQSASERSPPAGPSWPGAGAEEGAPEAPSPVKGRGNGRRFLLIGGVAAALLIGIGAAAFVGIRLFLGGGAESPEAAVETLVEGINSQDLALVASIIKPDELPMLSDLAGNLDEARGRVGLASGAEPVPGAEVVVDDLQLDVDELDDGVALVTVESADMMAKYDAGAAPLIDSFIEFDAGEPRDGAWESTLDDDDGLALMAVKSGRGWYLSPTMTAMHYWVGYQGYDAEREADFDALADREVFADGSESPEAAVEDMLDAVEGGDPEDLFELLPSDVAAPAAVYADWVMDRLEEEFPGGYNEVGFSFEDVELEVADGPAGGKRVYVTSMEIPSSEDVIEVDGLVVEDSDGDGYLNFGDAGSPLEQIVEEQVGESYYVVVREVDGGWKVDPVATVLDVADRLTEAVTPEVARSLSLSTDEEPTVTAELGTAAEVTLDEQGYALIEAPTEPGKLYGVTVERSEPDDFDLRYVVDTGASRRLESSWEHDTIAVVAGEEPLRVALSGFLVADDSAEVTVFEVPVVDHGLGEVSGALTAPVEVHRIDTGGVQDLAASCDAIDGASDSGEDTVSLGLTSFPEDQPIVDDLIGSGCSALYSDYLFDEASLPALGQGVYLVVEGEVGTTYSVTFEEARFGFDGSTTATAILPANGSVVVVPIEVPSAGSWVIDVRWSTSADIDGSVELDDGGFDEDNASGCCSFSLGVESSAATSGTVRLFVYSSGMTEPVTVSLNASPR